MANETKRLTLDMPEKVHKKLKALAALNGTSLKTLILSCVRDNLLSESSPNQETIEEMESTDRGENIVACRDVDDMIKQLGLHND